MAALNLATTEDLLEIAREVRALRLAVERLSPGDGTVLVELPEAARRLGLKLRAVQQRAKDGRLSVEIVGGVRMVRLPAAVASR